jgi:hypothetical protein
MHSADGADAAGECLEPSARKVRGPQDDKARMPHRHPREAMDPGLAES